MFSNARFECATERVRMPCRRYVWRGYPVAMAAAERASPCLAWQLAAWLTMHVPMLLQRGGIGCSCEVGGRRACLAA